MSQNTSRNPALAAGRDEMVIQRAAQRALLRHQKTYADEVRRLLDAGTEVMRRCGTTKSPRVADIIEHAGLSRDAFYRHFASKEDLVAAIVEAGAWRLVGYVDHQMRKVATPDDKLRQWVTAVMSQAVDPDVARTTRAVLWNGGRAPARTEPGSFDPSAVLAGLLVEPLRELPSPDPARDAAVIGHAVIGTMQTALQQGIIPDAAEVGHLVNFCLAAVGAGTGGRPAGTD